jgi:hypothetical protein
MTNKVSPNLLPMLMSSKSNILYISVHKTSQMSKDALKDLMICAKMGMLTWAYNKCIHPIYQSTPWYVVYASFLFSH